MIPAMVRSEQKRLRDKGISSVWALASQEFSHVGNAGVGVVSLKGAPLATPTFTTVGFVVIFSSWVERYVVCFRWVLVGLCIW